MCDVCYRGEIYYIMPGEAVGCEQYGGRPGIIVSNDANNRYSRTVEVVMLTTKKKPPLPTHVRINSAKYPSTALCEQITTVAKERIADYVGRLTPVEQSRVDVALLRSLFSQDAGIFQILRGGNCDGTAFGKADSVQHTHDQGHP